MIALPPTVSLWELGLEAAEPHPPRLLHGEALRSRLGVALHRRACASGCGDGRCQLPDACAFAACFEGDEALRPWRLDTSAVDGRAIDRRQPWAVRLATFAPGVEGLLLASLQDGAQPDRVLARRRLAHGGDHAPELAAGGRLDLGDRTHTLSRPVLVEARSPWVLKRRPAGGGASAPIAEPRPADLLHATLQRARRLGLPVAEWPRFTPEVDVLEAPPPTTTRLVHHTRRQPGPGLWVGVRPTWLLRPTAEQAAWLALAEVIGVGGRTAFGMGVVRCTPL